jgi:Ca2+-binding EF-hand superfamily protein
MYHPFVSSDAFSVFDQNQDGVIDFAEFLFMLACDSNSDLVKRYDEMFQM